MGFKAKFTALGGALLLNGANAAAQTENTQDKKENKIEVMELNNDHIKRLLKKPILLPNDYILSIAEDDGPAPLEYHLHAMVTNKNNPNDRFAVHDLEEALANKSFNKFPETTEKAIGAVFEMLKTNSTESLAKKGMALYQTKEGFLEIQPIKNTQPVKNIGAMMHQRGGASR